MNRNDGDTPSATHAGGGQVEAGRGENGHHERGQGERGPREIGRGESAPTGWKARGLGNAGLLVKTLAVVVILAAAKWFVHVQGWEIVTSFPLLSTLMGGVVFTLALLLAGTMADYKESERIVGELASQMRRMRNDLWLVTTSPATRARMQRHLLELAKAINANFRRHGTWKSSGVYAVLEAIDTDVQLAAQSGAASSQVRTAQVSVTNVQRIVDRIEAIVETTFLGAGYALAGTAMGAALLCLIVAEIEPIEQGVLLFSFAAFLLVGLFLLIHDLDNPFEGHARVSTYQMTKVEQWLERLVAQEAPAPGAEAPSRPPV